MKKLGIFAAALTILAGSSGLATAQLREDQGRPQVPAMGDHRGGEQRGGEQRGGEQRGGEQRGGEQRGNEHSDWRRGGRVAHEDWDRGRHIDYRDYRQYHLRQPPRGYEWREIDGRFVLAVIATGVITDIIILNAR
jgi:Ni/Co efflux regulator RcnB